MKLSIIGATVVPGFTDEANGTGYFLSDEQATLAAEICMLLGWSLQYLLYQLDLEVTVDFNSAVNTYMLRMSLAYGPKQSRAGSSADAVVKRTITGTEFQHDSTAEEIVDKFLCEVLWGELFNQNQRSNPEFTDSDEKLYLFIREKVAAKSHAN